MNARLESDDDLIPMAECANMLTVKLREYRDRTSKRPDFPPHAPHKQRNRVWRRGDIKHYIKYGRSP